VTLDLHGGYGSFGSDDLARHDQLQSDGPIEQDRPIDGYGKLPSQLSGLSAVKLSPELLRSIVRLEPAIAGKWRPDAV
jgi:hypothetical protein